MANGWRGLALPIHFKNGKLAMSVAIPSEGIFKKIDESIESIITSNLYENTMSGVGIPHYMLFKNFNNELIPYYEDTIMELINKYEPRVKCTGVTVDTEQNEDGLRKIDVSYIVTSSNIPRLISLYTDNY